MINDSKPLLEFGRFRLDSEKKLLWCDSEPVRLPMKAIELLCVLAESGNQVVTKDEIWRRVWQNSFVEETNLTHNIYLLRKTFKDLGEPDLIQNVPRRGYRLAREVREVETGNGEDEIIIERHAVSRTLIEEISDSPEDSDTLTHKSLDKLEGKSLRAFASPAFRVSFAVLLLAALLGGFAFWSYRNSAAKIPGGEIKSIAVLPFKSLNEETNQKHLGLGLADSLNLKLGGIKQLIVPPTSEVLNQSKSEENPLIIGQRLGADAVLDGSVQSENGNLRVNVRLLRVADGAQLWAGKFDDRVTNLFALQDSISARVSDSLALRLSSEEKKILAKRHTNNLKAYQNYVDGMFEMHKGTPDGWRKSLELFKQAIAEDADYALPYAALAVVYAVMSGFGETTPQEAMPQAKRAAQKAVELDESLAEAHLALASVKWNFDWDWAGAESEFRRAIELAPTLPSARNTYAHFLLTMSRPEEAVAESQKALELAPSDVYMNEDLAWVYLTVGRLEDATAQARKTLEMDERAYGAYLILGWIAQRRGDFKTAIAEIERARAIEPDNSFVEVELAYTLARAGRKIEAEKILAALKAKREYLSPYPQAILYAGLGDKERALFYLNQSFEQRVNEMVALRMEEKLNSLRDDPRFQEIMRKMKLSN